MPLVLLFVLILLPSFAQDLPEVLDLLQGQITPSAMTDEQCFTPDNGSIVSDVEACLHEVCGTSIKDELERAQKVYAKYNHPVAEEQFQKILPEINRRLADDERLLNSELEKASRFLPETASPEDQGQILGSYFQGFIDTRLGGPGVIHDPYGELTEKQKSILQEQYLNKPSSAFVCKGPDCREAFLTVPDVVQYRRLVTERPVRDYPKEEVISRCRLNFQSEAGEVYRTSQNEELTARMNKAKQKFLQTLQTKYSPETIKSLEEYLKGLKLSLNAEDDPFYNSVAENIRRPTQQEYSSEFVKTFSTIMSFRTGDQLSARVPLMNNCFGEYLKIHGAFGGDFIYLSQFSTLLPAAAEQIYYHELGHALSDFFKSKTTSAHSKEIYLQQRSCVTGYHSDNQQISDLSVFPGDSTRSEEEMGDFFRGVLAPADGPITTCMNFDFDPISKKYKDPLEKKVSSDEYSSNIERVILELSMKKKSLPSACQRVAKKLKLNLDRNCF